MERSITDFARLGQATLAITCHRRPSSRQYVGAHYHSISRKISVCGAVVAWARQGAANGPCDFRAELRDLKGHLGLSPGYCRLRQRTDCGRRSHGRRAPKCSNPPGWCRLLPASRGEPPSTKIHKCYRSAALSNPGATAGLPTRQDSRSARIC
jgi:hypothetical protein